MPLFNDTYSIYIFTPTVSFMNSTRFSSKSENNEYPLNFEWARASLTTRLDPRLAGKRL
jgi:hypothetical protein